jgi:hypothetical protein
LHKLNIMNAPLKTHEGPGQGWGPVGDVRQGPNERQVVGGGPGGGGTPFLQGLNVYQSEYKGKQGETRVQRTMMTFRVASSKHRDQGGRWDHPGLRPVNVVEDTYAWAQQEWVTSVEPALRAVILSKI